MRLPKVLLELGLIVVFGLVKLEWVCEKKMTFHRFEEKLVVFRQVEKDSGSSTIRPQDELALRFFFQTYPFLLKNSFFHFLEMIL